MLSNILASILIHFSPFRLKNARRRTIKTEVVEVLMISSQQDVHTHTHTHFTLYYYIAAVFVYPIVIYLSSFELLHEKKKRFMICLRIFLFIYL